MAKKKPQSPPQTPPPPVVVQLNAQPASPAHGAYTTNHIDIHMTARQADGMRQLYDTLMAENAVLDSGRRVMSPPDAVRYLLDQVADAFDSPAKEVA